jgi:NAD dependent epimerase/dehydratase family
MSSVAVYGDALGIVTEETSPVPPVNLYGQQKWMAEQLCRSLRLPHGLLSQCCGQRSYMDPRASYGPPCTSNASWQVN